jgi:hypothetical protein
MKERAGGPIHQSHQGLNKKKEQLHMSKNFAPAGNCMPRAIFPYYTDTQQSTSFPLLLLVIWGKNWKNALFSSQKSNMVFLKIFCNCSKYSMIKTSNRLKR